MSTENPDAIALLAEALEATVDLPPDMPIAGIYGTAGAVHLNWNDVQGVASLLLAHPRLARVMALGLAWVRAEEAADDPAGIEWEFSEDPSDDGSVRWMVRDLGDGAAYGMGPTPEAALTALAVALAEKIGGSK